MREKTDEEKLRFAARKETRRLEALLDTAVPIRKQKALREVVVNVAWMKVQLERARDEIGTAALVTEYDNGGGQTGLRANPAFTAYEALWKAYVSGMGRILDALQPGQLAKEKEPEELSPKNVLELMRAKYTAV